MHIYSLLRDLEFEFVLKYYKFVNYNAKKSLDNIRAIRSVAAEVVNVGLLKQVSLRRGGI